MERSYGSNIYNRMNSFIRLRLKEISFDGRFTRRQVM